MYCKNCGNQITKDYVFCPCCGESTDYVTQNDLTEDSSASPTAENEHAPKHPKRKIIGIAIIAVCLLILVVAISVLSGKGSFGGNGNQNGNAKSGAVLPPFDSHFTFSEQTLVETSEYRVTALALNIAGVRDDELKLSLLYENYSDRKLYFNTEIISVNQYDVHRFSRQTTVEANNKSQDYISTEIFDWMDSNGGLLELGIRNFYELEVCCTIEEDSIGWSGRDTIYNETFVFELNDTPTQIEDCFLEGIRDGSFTAMTEKTVEYISTEGNGRVDDFEIPAIALMNGRMGNELYIEFRNTGAEAINYDISDITINGLLMNDYPSGSPGDFGTIAAGKYAVLKIRIEPSELVKECFSLTEIGTVSFKVTADDVEKNVTFQIPGKDSSLNNSGQTIYEKNGIKIVYKGIYKRTEETWSFDNNYNRIYTTEDIYEMLVYVENTTTVDVEVELDPDSLFLNYKKTAFATYQTIAGTTNYRNFGKSHAGYSGYIIYELDSESMEKNGCGNPSVVKEIEAKIMINDGVYIKDTEIVRFSAE